MSNRASAKSLRRSAIQRLTESACKPAAALDFVGMQSERSFGIATVNPDKFEACFGQPSILKTRFGGTVVSTPAILPQLRTAHAS